LFSIAFAHLINDLMQSVIPSTYPILKRKFSLNFTNRLITFVYQLTASLLQPFIGFILIKPKPYSLAIGMVHDFWISFIIGVYFLDDISRSFLVGWFFIFHPEASRVAFGFWGKRFGAIHLSVRRQYWKCNRTIVSCLIVAPYGQSNIIWFVIVGGIFVLTKIAVWYQNHLNLRAAKKLPARKKLSLFEEKNTNFNRRVTAFNFSKFFYMSSMSSYFTFYLMKNLDLVFKSQFHLFVFLAAVAAGTLIGGPLGDRFGRKYIIWVSILGASFTLLLPYANLFWTGILSVYRNCAIGIFGHFSICTRIDAG
jgi:FSR family fosmidomycin resistance protein-like MFS transporter